MHSDTALLTSAHLFQKYVCLARYCVGVHPLRVGTHSLPPRSTTLRYATVGCADGAALHYVALRRRTSRLPHILYHLQLSYLRDILYAPAGSSPPSHIELFEFLFYCLII